MRNSKILFILKKRRVYDLPYEVAFSSGLYNSALFVCEMLNDNGIESKLVQVNDNNDIDREVHKYRPTTVIIEALWVVPEKFDVLHKLHPRVKWIVRLHSEMPFISNESIAMEWLFKYSRLARKNVSIGVNSTRMLKDLNKIGIANLVYLPNFYPVNKDTNVHFKKKDHIDVGCFGAIRPMKNQLIQAVAAIEFGNKIGKKIYFHINSGRVERGDGALKNIIDLFDNQKVHKLIQYPWLNHDDFLEVVRKMDLGMQLSFNETFNIVAADFVSQNIPMIGSKEIPWLNHFYKSDDTDTDDIVARLRFALQFRKIGFQKLNKKNLIQLCDAAKTIWTRTFRHA